MTFYLAKLLIDTAITLLIHADRNMLVGGCTLKFVGSICVLPLKITFAVLEDSNWITRNRLCKWMFEIQFKICFCQFPSNAGGNSLATLSPSLFSVYSRIKIIVLSLKPARE